MIDFLRFSPVIHWFFYQWRLVESGGTKAGNASEIFRKIRSLCSAARLAQTQAQMEVVESRIKALYPIPPEYKDLLSSAQQAADPVRKSLILKPYSPGTGEPGVVFISFEDQWVKLLSMSSGQLDEFAKRFLLVVSPTWTPPHSLVNCLFPQFYPGPIYTLISNETDLDTFPRLSEKYRMVDLFASNWVNPNVFRPAPDQQRDIDVFMLANFGTYKRHHVLFRALPHLPKEWKVIVVGQPEGQRDAQSLLREADAFGVAGRFELKQRIPNIELEQLIRRSKVSLICSRREGSCVAVVESMFSGTPVGLLKGAQIGSAKFINPETGTFLRESHFAEDLKAFHDRHEQFTPREWCLRNGISAVESSQRLNEFLKNESFRRGLPWTRDILPFHWHPNPAPLESDPPDWISSEAKEIEARFGIKMGSRA